jgi:Tfp pilus assembly protein PilF
VASTLAAGCSASQERDDQIRERAEYHTQLALGHYHSREIPMAIRELYAAVELYPNHAQALYLLGLIYQGRRDYPEAERYYLASIRANADFHEARNNLGTVYLSMRRWEEAEDVFRALTRVPTYNTPGNALNNLGWALYNQGRHREALEQFDTAILFQPDLCLSYNNRGLTLEQIGNRREAQRAYEQAIRRCDAYTEPQYRLALLLLAHETEEDLRRGVELLERCVELGRESEYGTRCSEYLEQLRW